MKKILSVILAFVLVFAVTIPCVAEDGGVITVGEWPQSRVTSLIKLVELNQKLKGCSPDWQTDFLPDGRTVQYADVSITQSSQNGLSIQLTRPTHRVVQIDGAYQWYNWEPLTWTAQAYRGRTVWICTSVVFAAQNDADTVLMWLQNAFYKSAFTAQEQDTYSVYLPTYSIAQDAPAVLAASTDYAALYGADGLSYCKVDDPEEESGTGHTHTHKPPTISVMPDSSRITDTTIPSDAKGGAKKTSAADVKPDSSPKNTKTAPAVSKQAPVLQAYAQSDYVGVRPILMERNETHGLIFCFLCWIFHR